MKRHEFQLDHISGNILSPFSSLENSEMEKEGAKVESLEKNNGSNRNDCPSSVIILGSGSSGCTPEFACLIQPSDPPCKVCFDSLSLPPEQSPNYRCAVLISALSLD